MLTKLLDFTVANGLALMDSQIKFPFIIAKKKSIPSSDLFNYSWLRCSCLPSYHIHHNILKLFSILLFLTLLSEG